MMNYITILDFVQGEVFIYNYTVNKEIGGEDLVIKFGHDPSNCQWLCTEGLKLQIAAIAD